MRPQCRHLVTAVLLATVASCVAQQVRFDYGHVCNGTYLFSQCCKHIRRNADNVSLHSQTTVIRVCVPLDVDPVACETAFNNTLNLSPGSGLYFKCRVGLNAPTCAQVSPFFL